MLCKNYLNFIDRIAELILINNNNSNNYTNNAVYITLKNAANIKSLSKIMFAVSNPGTYFK